MRHQVATTQPVAHRNANTTNQQLLTSQPLQPTTTSVLPSQYWTNEQHSQTSGNQNSTTDDSSQIQPQNQTPSTTSGMTSPY
jgi:hypothetical protein